VGEGASGMEKTLAHPTQVKKNQVSTAACVLLVFGLGDYLPASVNWREMEGLFIVGFAETALMLPVRVLFKRSRVCFRDNYTSQLLRFLLSFRSYGKPRSVVHTVLGAQSVVRHF